jgi:hypothetical protein
MIRAHIIRTAEVDEDLFASVVQYLQQFKGEVEFIAHQETFAMPEKKDKVIKMDDEDFDKAFPVMCEYNLQMPEASKSFKKELDFPSVGAYSWDKFFALIDKFRKKKKNALPSDSRPSDVRKSESNQVKPEDHVFILTYQGNIEKWFVGSEMHNGRNHFIHLLYWNHYLMSEPIYPVAYHVMSTILRNQTFGHYNEYMSLFHEKAKGCMMDLCLDKHDIILKMRTADICSVCMEAIQRKGVNQALLRQALQIFDHVRAQVLFRERFVHVPIFSSIRIDRRNGELIFPEMSNLVVKLNPLELTVYLFFIRHERGIILSYLPDYYDELLQIYQVLQPSLDRDDAALRIADLTNPLSNSISEKISRIKSKLKNMLGEEIAASYVIAGPNGGLKRIGIARDLVEEII